MTPLTLGEVEHDRVDVPYRGVTTRATSRRGRPGAEPTRRHALICSGVVIDERLLLAGTELPGFLALRPRRAPGRGNPPRTLGDRRSEVKEEGLAAGQARGT